MIWTALAIIAGVLTLVLILVAAVARALSSIGRGELSLVETYQGPPEVAEAHAQLQRLELQYELGESLGNLDSGSLEDLRQQVVAARTRYEETLAFLRQTELLPQVQLPPTLASKDSLLRNFPGASAIPVTALTDNGSAHVDSKCASDKAE